MLHLAKPHDPTPAVGSGGGLPQAVCSAPGRHRAEVASLRLDCHLPLTRKLQFMGALDELCWQANLDVLYYLDYELPEQVNLMVFFSNGRQGVGGQPLRYTNTKTLTKAVAACLAAHGGQPGHLGKYPAAYLQRGPHVVRIINAKFIW